MFKVTLEPMVLLRALAVFIVYGAQITTDLLLWKVCYYEQKHPEEVCRNLSLPEYKEVRGEVQRQANDFLMISSWLKSGPALIYSLFAGALADDYGYKFFIALPLVRLAINVRFISL